MNRIGTLLIALAVVAGCKSKTKPEDKPAVASGSVVATVDAAAAPATNTNTVKLPTGEPKFGCLGWSPSAKVAACVVGETGAGEEAKYALAYVGGSEPAAKLDEAANATLAKLGVEPFAQPAKKVDEGRTVDLGAGASIQWVAKIKDEGGENQARTAKHDVVVTCANKQTVDVHKSEAEGTDPEIWVWMVPDHVVIDVNTHVGREGESSDSREAMVLELATCKVTRSKS